MTDDRETDREVASGSTSESGSSYTGRATPEPVRPGSQPTDAGPVDPASVEPSSVEPSSVEPSSVEPSSVDGDRSEAVPSEAPSDGVPTADTAGESVPEGETRRQRRKRTKAATPRRKAPWWELPLLVAIAIGIAIVVKSFVVQPFYIPSESMEKTLHGCTGCSGDRILVNKPIYSIFRDPEPGDIVVFDAPDGWDAEGPTTTSGNPVSKVVRGFGQLVGVVPPDGEVLVKRVIAVGGQTVRGVETRGAGGLTVDRIQISTSGPDGPWRTLDEPFTYRDSVHGNETKFGPVTVPKGRLWVMGDHRNDSADSRYHCVAGGGQDTTQDTDCDPMSSTVPDDKVIGKATVIAWPPSRWRTLGTPSTFESSADAAGPALPSIAALGAVVPVFLVRRRRRSGR